MKRGCGMSKNVFVTGTGTDVGKTYVTALMVKKLRDAGFRAAYYKAAMSGNDRRADGSLIPGDALCVRTVSGISQPLEDMCPFVYEHAYSPHLASRIEGRPVRMDAVKNGFSALEKTYDYVTMEGSGGILCPLCTDGAKIQLEDVIGQLNLGCVIVADAGLGTINDVVLTTFYMRQKHIPVRGLIFNRWHPGSLLEEDNLRMCASMTGLKILACVGVGETELNIRTEDLTAVYD